jgi:hypothetical protein
VCSLGIVQITKDIKCLEVSSGRVYASRDVVFDEIVSPFDEMHPNAGARLKAEISLLPPTLLFTNPGCNIDMTGANPTDSANELVGSGLNSAPCMNIEETNVGDSGNT